MDADNAASIERIRDVLKRPGMFLVEDDLSYAIAFISGLNCGLEPEPLEGFRDWLANKHFGGSSPFAWEALIRRLPCCSSDDDAENVRAFLAIVGVYLDSVEAA